MIPPEIASIFDPIKRDFVWLSGAWRVFRQLFLESRERVELLDKSASGVFSVLQDTLRDCIFLGIGRVTDPVRSVGKENLSLARLHAEVAAVAPSTLASAVASHLDRVERLSAPFRDWRNRHLAHSDLKTRLQVHPTPLPGVTRKAIDDILEGIAAVLNEIERHYNDATTLYDATSVGGDGDSLIKVLERGEKHRECERRDFEEKYGVKLDE